MSGAWVRRATLQAAEGAPMPTKQTSSLDRARAAAIVIISVGVKPVISKAFHAVGESGRPGVQHGFGHEGGEGVPIARYPVPGEIGGIVAGIVAMRIGGMGAAGHDGDGGDCPMRE